MLNPLKHISAGPDIFKHMLFGLFDFEVFVLFLITRVRILDLSQVRPSTPILLSTK